MEKDSNMTEKERSAIESAIQDVDVDREMYISDFDLDDLPIASDGSVYVDTFRAHEAIDRSFLVSDAWERHVLSHPGVFLNEAAFRSASIAHQMMFETYQILGNAEYEETEDDKDDAEEEEEASGSHHGENGRDKPIIQTPPQG